MKILFDFLNDLYKNNTKQWFDANKQRYAESRDQMLFLTGVMLQEISKFDPEVSSVSPSECLFRIYRDIRFSRDKTPYKTHMGSYMAAGGRKSQRAGYYLHIEPGNSLISGGIWSPEANPLRAIRTEIHDNADEFKEILNDNGFQEYFQEIEGDKLKAAPKGFDKNFRDIDLLKYKSYVFSTPIPDQQLLNGNFIDDAIKGYKELYKINRFLNAGLDKWL